MPVDALTDETLKKARASLGVRFKKNPIVAQALEKCFKEFKEFWMVIAYLEKEHRRWPRIAKLEKELLIELERTLVARREGKSLIPELEDHLKRMESFTRKLPPRRWRQNYFTTELVRTVGRTLRNSNVKLTISENGCFGSAVKIAFKAFGEDIERVWRYLQKAKPVIQETPAFLLSEAPNEFSRESVIIAGPAKSQGGESGLRLVRKKKAAGEVS